MKRAEKKLKAMLRGQVLVDPTVIIQLFTNGERQPYAMYESVVYTAEMQSALKRRTGGAYALRNMTKAYPSVAARLTAHWPCHGKSLRQGWRAQVDRTAKRTNRT